MCAFDIKQLATVAFELRASRRSGGDPELEEVGAQEHYVVRRVDVGQRTSPSGTLR